MSKERKSVGDPDGIPDGHRPAKAGKDPAPGERPAYLWVRRPRCPRCGSVRLVAYDSRDVGDGVRVRHARCKDCQRRLVVIVE